MPRWRVPVGLLIVDETSGGVTRRAERALRDIVAKDADFCRAIGQRPPRYLLGAIRSEAPPLPRRMWLPRRVP